MWQSFSFSLQALPLLIPLPIPLRLHKMAAKIGAIWATLTGEDRVDVKLETCSAQAVCVVHADSDLQVMHTVVHIHITCL